MTINSRKLPIGIQDFEKLRTGGNVYVDKTAYVYSLVKSGKPYFLGRPRRFGKSLFLSTLKAYFLGKKELFEGLAIAELEEDWTEYPVIYIDFSKASFNDIASLNAVLDSTLQELEREWGADPNDKLPSLRLGGLIRRACKKTKQRVVVLVDEYDKPLWDTLDDINVNDEICNALRSFYNILKGSDAYLHFVMLTGVMRFPRGSMLSGEFNHLLDISMYERYAGSCGISEDELLGNFEPELQALAKEQGMTCEEALAEMEKRYDGYHFCENTVGMYNPFSVLKTFSCRDFVNYWFQSDTPTSLAKMVRNAGLDIRKFEGEITISADSISDYRVEYRDPTPLLYQSGYLTIKDYNSMFYEYSLGFPNEEVKYGFLNELLPIYAPTQGSDFFIGLFVEDLRAGNVDGFMTRLRAFFAGIPNDIENKTEKHYQTIFYLLFTMMGQFVQTEVKNAFGNADAVVKTPGSVFVFEFKLDGNASAEAALKQIDGKSYSIQYTAGNRKIVKIGVEFNTKERTIGRWLVSN
jgi:hypothetical protein